jgi:hypothetical protein
MEREREAGDANGDTGKLLSSELESNLEKLHDYLGV